MVPKSMNSPITFKPSSLNPPTMLNSISLGKSSNKLPNTFVSAESTTNFSDLSSIYMPATGHHPLNTFATYPPSTHSIDILNKESLHAPARRTRFRFEKMWLKEEEAAAIIRTNWSSDNPGDIGWTVNHPATPDRRRRFQTGHKSLFSSLLLFEDHHQVVFRILKLLCYITEGIATGEARKEDFTSVTNLLADPRSRA
ncbi:hypothetical protein G4B88_013832 [Cannabis sativa]|uniref:Uncharacterized protein n=1 Tax=Cannabis sativa TaxID=3483 RepID=A0A7J6I1T3_CANSA|nr:hypothetical protein G4B88_013832 [Cannabis sativa]